MVSRFDASVIDVIKGNLLSREDCAKATKDVSVIIHLAAGVDKSFPGNVMNSVLTTRNLLESIKGNKGFKRFLSVSTIAVYSNRKIGRHGMLDETCKIETDLERRSDPYMYGKTKQDELVREYSRKFNIPYVLVRPGAVYGPGKVALTGRVGIDTFGIFLHLGGRNRIPLTYVDNCAEAVLLAGIVKGVDNEVFNIVDDDLPTSRKFLSLFKKKARRFKSLYVPYWVFYLFSLAWEKYSKWSFGQLPPAFNRSKCSTNWKGNRYSNQKAKNLLGWTPRVPFSQASELYFTYMRENWSK
jgi:nucleoside-diphosphate-sugar epimerase